MRPKGPMPQTRFVLKKAFQHELRPIVVINKIDRPDARADEVLDEVFDLFVELGADDETLDFPVLYASGRAGTASWKLEEPGTSIKPVFEALLKHIPAPHGDPDKLASDPHQQHPVQRLRRPDRRRPHHNGVIKTGQQVTIVKRDGTQVKSKVAAGAGVRRLRPQERREAAAGDIVALIGLESSTSATASATRNPQPLEAEDVEPPTLTMMFSVNDFALRRQGRQVRHQPQHPRAALQGAGIQRRAEGRGNRQQGRLQGLRPRPAAPGHPDREHAPRRLRAVHQQAARHHEARTRRPARLSSRSSTSSSTSPRRTWAA
jgi:predicted membrane GTPase involved in stress response